MSALAPGDLSLVDERLWVVSCRTGLQVYDFDFASCFTVRHPVRLEQPVRGVARLGAVADYASAYEAWRDRGVTFVNSPEDALLADDLSRWYPRLADLSPRSMVFDSLPDVSEIEAEVDWPVFIKGVRQTSRHDASLSVIGSRDHYERLAARWLDDPILATQRVAVRELVALRVVRQPTHPRELPRSFEFRTFWWHGRLAGAGPYWTDAGKYDWSGTQRDAALAVAGEAVRRLNIGFLCVDVALTADDKWIVIEVNDGQRAGYAGLSRIAMWRAICDLM